LLAGRGVSDACSCSGECAVAFVAVRTVFESVVGSAAVAERVSPALVVVIGCSSWPNRS